MTKSDIFIDSLGDYYTNNLLKQKNIILDKTDY